MQNDTTGSHPLDRLLDYPSFVRAMVDDLKALRAGKITVAQARARAALAAAQAENAKLREALEWASGHYGNPNIDHEAYRVEMCRRADLALGRPDFAERMLGAIFPRAALAQGGLDDG